MLNDHQVLKWLLVGVLILLVLPLVVMVLMMSVGAVTGTGMMSSMGGMVSGATGAMAMSGGLMAVCFLWMGLVAAALVFLIVLLVRGVRPA